MAFNRSIILVINIIFGLCIGNMRTIQVFPRHPVPRIPIRPLDHSTMRRLSLRPTEINPDSEPVFITSRLTRNRPLQIMERILAPNDANQNRMNRHQDKLDVLNYNGYVMPHGIMNGHVPSSVTERAYRLVNHTDYYGGDTNPSPSHYKYRTKISKKSKKPSNGQINGMPGNEFDDLEFYRAYLENRKHAAMVKRLKSRSEPISRLPIGVEFFDQKQLNQMSFAPNTNQMALQYPNNVHRSHHHEDVEASNVQHVQMRHPHLIFHDESLDGLATTPMTPIPTTIIMPIENEPQAQAQTQIQSQTIIPSDLRSSQEQEQEPFHSLASEPEMYRFTIDDVVVKQPPVGMVKYPYAGPVTLPPPLLKYQNVPNSNMVRSDLLLPMTANMMMHENQFDYQTQISYPPNPYINVNYQRPIENRPYQNMPIESASSYQEMQKYSSNPIPMTTQMPIINIPDRETNDTVDFTKMANEMEAKRNVLEKRFKRRRQHLERHRPGARKVNQQPDLMNNLEFSSSYTKRRTQGYNSEEEPATTPISPAKLRSMKDEMNADDMVTSTTPKSEKIKYFQDTLTEQIAPHQIDFGHLSENPNGWEERYERKNLKAQRHQGRVKWGDRKGNFGEHYYDLNHHRNMKQSNDTRLT